MRNEPERLTESDEINLPEMISGLWKQRLLIILTTLIVTVAGVTYCLLVKPVYEAKVVLQQPTHNDIAQLNYGRGGSSGLGLLTIKDVYDVFLRNLQSDSLRREFFRQFFLPSLSPEERRGSQDELYRQMSEILTVEMASKDTPSRYSVQAELPNPEEAATWVVRYAQMAGERAKREVIRDARAEALVKANNLEQQINAARESARKEREDRIARLTEALNVARSIGLEKPPIISNNLSSEVSAGMEGSLTYMRGSKALEAEIGNLHNRSSDDPFIDNLRRRQEALSFYRSLQIDPGVIEVYRQDGAVESPDKPVKPKKLLIVLLSGLTGMVMGVIFGLLRYALAGLATRKPHSI